MADNIDVSPTAEYTVASDDASGVHHQYVKMEWGADNTQTKVGAGANALPIQDGGNSLTVDGTVTANAGTGPWPVTDNGGSLTVDGTVAVSGTVAVTDNSGSLTVDGTVTANGGTGPFPVAGMAATDAAVSGNPVYAGGRASTATPSAMSADGDVVPMWADRNGAQMVRARPAGNATLANVNGATSSTTLQASNTARLGLTIVNDSSAILYVKFGSTASATSYTYRLDPGAILELPTSPAIYTGIVTGIWSSATGAARMTEVTT